MVFGKVLRGTRRRHIQSGCHYGSLLGGAAAVGVEKISPESDFVLMGLKLWKALRILIGNRSTFQSKAIFNF